MGTRAERAYIFSGTLILNMVSTLKMTFLTPMQRAKRALSLIHI